MQDVPSRLADFPSYLMYILLNPTFNPQAALILYGAIGVLLLILLVIGIMIIARSPGDDEVSREKKPVHSGSSGQPVVGGGREGSEVGGGPATTRRPLPPVRRTKPPVPPMGPPARLAVTVAAIVVVIAAWAMAGYTTSDSTLCKNCHWPAAEHADAADGADPHVGVACISCHEPGGIVGRYITDVPARLIHFADTQSSTPRQEEYGRITIVACSACHRAALEGVATNETRALMVSHQEPLAASATCIDCHSLRAGVVGPHNAGMTPCLRCHDTELASAECATCHDRRAAAAARARTTSFATVQIPDVTCGGCHDEKVECDGCHGMRLPHSTEFIAYAHARAGAADFWFNGGKACARCHTASRRPCQRCHGENLGKAHGAGATSLAAAHRGASAQACDGCHRQFAYAATRDFCKDLCHTPAAIAASPR